MHGIYLQETNSNGIGRFRPSRPDLDYLVNHVDTMVLKHTRKMYNNKLGDLLKDINEVTRRLSCDGSSIGELLVNMRNRKRYRPYEQQLQNTLIKFFKNGKPIGIDHILLLALSHIDEEPVPINQVVTEDEEFNKEPSKWVNKSNEVEYLLTEGGYYVTILVLKYLVLYWGKV